MENTGHPFARALSRLGNDKELFHELIGFFGEDAPGLLAAIRTAAVVGRRDAVIRAAHSLRGLLANFDAERAISAADMIESMARDGELQSVTGPFHELEKEVHLLQFALNEYEAEISSSVAAK